MRPFCQACENNKVPILKVLQRVLADSKGVLEIGSGTGQHAVYFAARLPHLQWYPSDLPERLAAIRSWSEAHPAENLREPIPLDAEASDWVVPRHCDAAFTANTLHILSWDAVVSLFAHLGAQTTLTTLVVYGPFNYGGQYTAAGNARFDHWLRSQDVNQGLRNFEAVVDLARTQGFELQEDNAMPANNRLLLWHRIR